MRVANLNSKLIGLMQHRVLTRTGKPGKMGRHFPVREKSGNLNRLEKSGKITQNTGQLREFPTKVICYFLMIFKLTVYYLCRTIKVKDMV